MKPLLSSTSAMAVVLSFGMLVMPTPHLTSVSYAQAVDPGVAVLQQQAANIRQQIQNARAQGQDTSALEQQLATIQVQLQALGATGGNSAYQTPQPAPQPAPQPDPQAEQQRQEQERQRQQQEEQRRQQQEQQERERQQQEQERRQQQERQQQEEQQRERQRQEEQLRQERQRLQEERQREQQRLDDDRQRQLDEIRRERQQIEERARQRNENLTREERRQLRDERRERRQERRQERREERQQQGADNSNQAPQAVISDRLSEEERQRIAQAERERREKARRDRIKLLGAAAAGVAVGAILPKLGEVVGDEGDRIYVERDGQLYVRKDENALLREDNARIERQNIGNGLTREIVTRPNGVQVITDRDEFGYVIYRSRIRRDGREVILIDNRDDRGRTDPRDVRIPERIERIPLSELVIEADDADQRSLQRALDARDLRLRDQRFTLRTVRENSEVRDLVQRVDLTAITFDSGSFSLFESQVRLLGDLASAMQFQISNDPSTVFLIEGHTDAVGSEISNLALSDRRAESVARVLIDIYRVPPENLITQGYGEQFLKVNTLESNRANRRVTMRNITPLVSQR